MLRLQWLALTAIAGLCLLISQPVVHADPPAKPNQKHEVKADTEVGVIKSIDAEANQFTMKVRGGEKSHEVIVTCNDETKYETKGKEVTKDEVVKVGARVRVVSKEGVATLVDLLNEKKKQKDQE